MKDLVNNSGQVEQKNVEGYIPSQRDHFAGITLGGMLAHSTRYRPREGDGVDWHEPIAREAYEIADKMISCGDNK